MKSTQLLLTWASINFREFQETRDSIWIGNCHKAARGSWTLWLRENIDFSERTAQVYMQVGRNPQRAADSLRQALGDDEAKRAADLQAHIDLIDQRSSPGAASLYVGSCAALFASGIRPDAVITQPPSGPEHLSELALACQGVPLVAVMLDLAYLLEVTDRLRAHLTYRGGSKHGCPGDSKVTLVFGQHGAFERAKARARAVPDPTPLRPYETWEEFFVQRLCGPGELVCDPFMRPTTAIAALEFGRRSVGCHVDAGMVADTRRQIGAVQ